MPWPLQASHTNSTTNVYFSSSTDRLAKSGGSATPVGKTFKGLCSTAEDVVLISILAVPTSHKYSTTGSAISGCAQSSRALAIAAEARDLVGLTGQSVTHIISMFRV